MIQDPKRRRFFKDTWFWMLLALFFLFTIALLAGTLTGRTAKVEAAADRWQISSPQDAIAQLSTSETQITFTQATAAATSLSPTVDAPSSDNCISCHTDKKQLKAFAEEAEAVESTEAFGEELTGELPSLEVWQKVLINKKKYLKNDVHAEVGCIDCHGGAPDTDDKEEAHAGMVVKVSADPMKACGGCHKEYAEAAQSNVHRLQTGSQEALAHRGADFTDPAFVQAYGNHCTSCHADCGDCHVSRPSVLDGGLISGHKFEKTASVWLTCGGCHSASVTDEYKGNFEAIPQDIHWQKLGATCNKCHDGSSYHDGSHGVRYDGDQSFACIDCHEADVKPGGEIEQHDAQHLDAMACQTCHAAGAYKSCFGCHTGVDSQGIDYVTTEPSQMTFKIGHNPLKSDERPWDWVLLRHVPTNADLFAYYGENMLPNFDAVPTWKYATPHNMQSVTPQNASCNNCHGQSELFLTANDVDPIERVANQPVIVAPDDIPQYLPDQPAPVTPVAPGEEGGS